jgi:uncharacterized protein (DUF305 family)
LASTGKLLTFPRWQGLRRELKPEDHMFKLTIAGLALALCATPSLALDLPAICTANAMKMEMQKMPTMPMDQAHSDLMAGMDKMNNDMMAGSTAKDLDVAFACSMLPHHQGAIDMAKAELAHGDDPKMRQLATEIIAAQEKEISQMMDWLAAQK